MKINAIFLHYIGKRIVTGLLVICLVAGMFPAQVFYGQAAEKPTFNIDFRICNASGHFARVDHATISDHGWTYNKEASVIGADNKFFQMSKEGLSYRSATSNWGNQANECITLDINVPETGVYDLKVITGKNNDAGLTDIYIDNQKIGQYDAYDTAGTSDACIMSDPLLVGEVELTKGLHQLKVQFVQRVEIRLAELQFFKKSGDIPSVEWDFSLCNPSGHLAAITHAKLSDHGWEYNEAASRPGDSPKFLQLKREELAYRAATALWSDPNKYITLDVNIPENGVYDLRLITGKNADSGKVDVFFDDQRVGQYDAYDSAATSDACSWSDMLDIGSVALKAGVHQLKFQVLNRLELRIKKVALYKTAELADFSIDFRSCLTEEHGADPMHATFSNHNWQFDKAGSDADGFQWAKMIDQGFAARYNWIAGAEGAKRVAFDFMVPESGYYDMDMVVGMNVDGAQFRTYIDGIRLDVKQNPSYPDRIFSYQAVGLYSVSRSLCQSKSV